MRARLLCALLLSCLILGLSNVAVRADDKSDASAFANTVGQKAVTILTDKSLSKDMQRTNLEQLFSENVDIDWIGKFVLGRAWKSATPDQQQRYLTNYKAFLIKHYTSNLSEFTDADFQVVKVDADAQQGGFLVTIRVKRPNAEDVIADYSVRKEPSGFKIYDIMIEGVSMITTQRSEFASVVSQKGLDYLIDQLAKRSQQAAAGDE